MSYQQNRAWRQRPLLKPQRGVVIVLALFIVALVATLAYLMLANLARDTYRTALLLHEQQAENNAQGSLLWAKDSLRNDWEHQKPNQLTDHLPLRSPIQRIDGYTTYSVIEDAQARFNLNNLGAGNLSAQTQFMQLLQMLDPTLTVSARAALAQAITDWITPVTQTSVNDRYYLGLPTPYRSAHQLMQSASELLLVRGMTQALYHLLQPYVIALPVTTMINVATATAPVLMTLSASLSLEQAQAIANICKATPPASTSAFLELDRVKNRRISPTDITVTSHYFLVETHVKIETQEVVLYTLLERTVGDKTTLTTLWQSMEP